MGLEESISISLDKLQNFSDDVGFLWASNSKIPILEEPPSSLTFLREYVSMSRPCIIRNAIPTPPSLQRECKQQGKVLEKQKNHPLRLTLDDLVELAAQDGDEEMILTVDSTPDGHGDCVRTVWPNDNQRNQRIEVKNTRKLKKMFVKPEEKKMSLTTFRKLLRKGRFHYREKRSNNFEGDTCIKGELQIFPEGLETAELSNGKDTADHAVLYYSRQVSSLSK